MIKALGGIHIKKLTIILACIFLIGCTPKAYTENLNAGKDALEDADYDKAVKFFEVAEKEKNTKEIDELLSISKILHDSVTAKKEGEFEVSTYNAEKIIDYKVTEEVNTEIIENVKNQAKEILVQIEADNTHLEELMATISKGKELIEQQKFDEALSIFSAITTQEKQYPDYKVFKDLKDQASKLEKETINQKSVYEAEQQKKVAAEEELKRKKAEEERQRKIAKEKEAQNAKVSKEQAKQLVIKYLGVPNSPNLFVEYNYDNEHGDYVFQVYEVVIDDPVTKEGHHATWGWYAVDPKNKYVYEALIY